MLNAFDLADQIALRGMVQMNNRRAGTGLVFDNDIDFEFGKLVFFGLFDF